MRYFSFFSLTILPDEGRQSWLHGCRDKREGVLSWVPRCSVCAFLHFRASCPVGSVVSDSSQAFLIGTAPLSILYKVGLCSLPPGCGGSAGLQGTWRRHRSEKPWVPESLCGEDEPRWFAGPHHGTRGENRFHWVQTLKSLLRQLDVITLMDTVFDRQLEYAWLDH